MLALHFTLSDNWEQSCGSGFIASGSGSSISSESGSVSNPFWWKKNFISFFDEIFQFTYVQAAGEVVSPQKRTSSNSKNEIYKLFFMFVGHLSLLDPSGLRIRIRIHEPHWIQIRIRIHNTAWEFKQSPLFHHIKRTTYLGASLGFRGEVPVHPGPHFKVQHAGLRVTYPGQALISWSTNWGLYHPLSIKHG